MTEVRPQSWESHLDSLPFSKSLLPEQGEGDGEVAVLICDSFQKNRGSVAYHLHQYLARASSR